MKLELGQKFMVVCIQCDKKVEAGAGAQGHRDCARPPVYADLEGIPWKAYYCADCAAQVAGAGVAGEVRP